MTTETNPRTNNRGPIGTIRVSTPLLVGVVLAVSLPAGAAVAACAGAFNQNHQDTTGFSVAGPVQTVVVHGANDTVRVRTDKAVSGVSGKVTVDWPDGSAKPQATETVQDGVATLDFGRPGFDGGVGWDVTVPPGVAVKLDTTNATVYVSGVTGAVVAGTTNGSIEATGLGDGDAVFSSTNGDIHAAFAGAPASIKATTTNANVEITTDRTTRYYDHVSTTNGNQDLSNPGNDDYTLAATRRIDVMTTNGNVTVR